MTLFLILRHCFNSPTYIFFLTFVLPGWLNPILEGIKFWKGLEWLVSKVTGLVPREDDYKWTGLVDDTPTVVKNYLKTKTSPSPNTTTTKRTR